MGDGVSHGARQSRLQSALDLSIMLTRERNFSYESLL